MDRISIILLFALDAGLPPVRTTGLSTIYYRGDGMSGAHLGCVAAARRLLGHNEFRDDLPIIATRHSPACGTPVLVENVRTGLRAWAVKLDTGPWSCYRPDGSRTVAVRCAGRRKSIADLTLRVSREVGFNGFEHIRIRWDMRTLRETAWQKAASILLAKMPSASVRREGSQTREGAAEGASLPVW